jgi:hypothetical protein
MRSLQTASATGFALVARELTVSALGRVGMER